MRHVTCDSCNRDLSDRGGSHYTVKMDTHVVPAGGGLTEDDFDEDTESDSVHEMELMMQGTFEDAEIVEPRLLRKEFDFCEGCYAKFSADPLGLERAGRRRFSTN